MIGNGYFLQGHAIQYTTGHIDLAALVTGYAMELFNGEIKATINPERTWIQVCLSSKRRHTHGVHSMVREWFEGYGLFGKRSHKKFLPTPAFAQPDTAIRRFQHLHAARTPGGFSSSKRASSRFRLS